MDSIQSPTRLIENLQQSLSELLHQLKKFTKDEEVFARVVQSHKILDLSRVESFDLYRRLYYEFWKTCNQFNNEISNHLLEPLKRLLNVLSDVSSLFARREEILKTIDKKTKKLQKSASIDSTGKILKRAQTIDVLNVQLDNTEKLISVELPEFVNFVELFLSSSFIVYLYWTRETNQVGRETNKSLTQHICAPLNPPELSRLKQQMNEEFNHIYELLSVNPDK